MITRRLFVKSSGMALLSLGFAPSFLTRTAEAAGRGRRLLIAIFQRGAADGLNIVVPYGDAEYYTLRPAIAIPRPNTTNLAAIDLDGHFALHPRLAPLKPFWDDKALAIVHACGSPDATRSHFDAQDYMESATPGVKSTADGWLNRYLAATDALSRRSAGGGGNPLRGVALARQMPRSLQGTAPALAIGSVGNFAVRGGAGSSFEEAYQRAADGVLAQSSSEAFDAMRTLRRAAAAARPAASGVQYPRSPFGQALQEIATIAKADVGLEVAFAESTNWDHHVNEGGANGLLATRVDDLARGIAALAADLGERMSDTVILTMSEFGRRAAQNGNGGTDHGHGNAMFLLGGPVRGGRVYGRWPGLTSEALYDGRDLAVTTDFRDVFAEVVVNHLGAEPAALGRIFPGYGSARGPGVIA
jgi:uncharacterized protein (DUF1501 family)